MRATGVITVLAVLFTLGCGSSSSSSTAQLRIMNASPQQQDLNLLLDNNNFQTGVVYASSTAYASEPAGTHSAQIQQAGSNASLVTQSIAVTGGSYYTILAVEPAFNSSDVGMTLITDDNSAPASGNFKLRIINASPDLGNFDAYIVAPGTDLASVSPGISNLAFQAPSGYQSLTAGNYEIYITLPNQKVISVDSGQLTFSAGQIRTVVILDNPGGGYSSALVADLN
jgi:hypothetical protein